jgi:hypothetical protein
MLKAVMIIIFCASFSISFAKPRLNSIVSLANEHVYISPFTDSSSMQAVEGWPKDKPSQGLLAVHFRECYKGLFAELKRCEKFGYYEAVEDSASATVFILLTILPCRLAHDSLYLPVTVELRHKTGLDTFKKTFQTCGIYRVKSKSKSPFHKLNYLLADFRRHFPYSEVVALFYAKP